MSDQELVLVASKSGRTRTVVGELLSAALAMGTLLLALRMSLKLLDPYKEQRQEAKRRAASLHKRLGRKVELNEFEQLLAANVLNPATIDVSVDDISGLDELVREMELKVLSPLAHADIYCTTLWRPTKGVLFYGPPGTGKTMLAKALARESQCYFLNVTASTVMSKWLGDANRLIRAIFTLAYKLQPCIIFIDEVDAFLTKRGLNAEHEATLQAKTEFMQLWDGLESVTGARVVVMGATNRPWMVDDAVLRRFALQYEVGLPDQKQRAKILLGYLRKHEAEVGHLGRGGVEPALLNNKPCEGSGGMGALDFVAAATEEFSGSDLMELCSQAAQQVLTEYWSHRHSGGDDTTFFARPLALSDFIKAFVRVRASTSRSEEYFHQQTGRQGAGAANGLAQRLPRGVPSSSGSGRSGDAAAQADAAAAVQAMLSALMGAGAAGGTGPPVLPVLPMLPPQLPSVNGHGGEASSSGVGAGVGGDGAAIQRLRELAATINFVVDSYGLQQQQQQQQHAANGGSGRGSSGSGAAASKGDGSKQPAGAS